MSSDITLLAAPLVSLVALLLFARAVRGPRTQALLGPAADWWELLRRTLLPTLDRLLRRRAPGQHYAAYTLSLDEVVGVVDAAPEEVERVLWEAGARRMPLAAFKTLPDGRREIGSWAFRDDLLATHQTHVMLFEAEAGTLVAAHREANALNPWRAVAHYRGAEYDVVAGGREVRRRLDEGVWDEE